MAADHTTRTSLRCFVWYSKEAEVLSIDECPLEVLFF